LIPDA